MHEVSARDRRFRQRHASIDSVSPAFVSHLDPAIRHHRPDAWLFGHAHRWLETRVGRTLIRNLSLGYPDAVDPAHGQTLLLRGMIEGGESR